MTKILTASLKNPQTTAAAVIGVVYALAKIGLAVVDQDETTKPDLDLLMMALIGAYGFFMARDANKTSEDSGLSSKE